MFLTRRASVELNEEQKRNNAGCNYVGVSWLRGNILLTVVPQRSILSPRQRVNRGVKVNGVYYGLLVKAGLTNNSSVI